MNADFKARLGERIEALARLSESPDHLTRPSFTPSMKAANAAVGGWMRDAEMAVREDGIANLIGRYEGETPDAKTLVIGSHIDTVIDAGKYDGTLGVLLGLACIEELANAGRRLPFAIEVIAFTDEEGLRFQLPYIGSRGITGTLTATDLARTDENGVSLADAMAAYGGLPPMEGARSPDALLGYLEAHIEQGPVLEAMNLPVGIVSGIQGQTRLEIAFTGEAGHAGTVPMALRRDALVAAARFITAVQDIARATDGLVATVGQLQVLPGASNAIPGKVVLSLDLRHMNDDIRRDSLDSLHAQARAIADADGIGLAWTVITDNSPVPCAAPMMDALRQATDRLGIMPHILSSGAGHDAAMMSLLAPSGMLFVRCRAGISHNPAEFCALEDAEVAADVLMGAIEALAAR